METQDENRELFGFERARRISMQPAAAIAEALVQFGQSDDLTTMTVERVGKPFESVIWAIASCGSDFDSAVLAGCIRELGANWCKATRMRYFQMDENQRGSRLTKWARQGS